MSTTRDIAMAAKAWPFEEARKLLERARLRAFPSGPVQATFG